jgi:hypothetical protein
MAEIDKSLPNEVRNSIEIPGPGALAEEQVNIQEELPIQGPRKLHH